MIHGRKTTEFMRRDSNHSQGGTLAQKKISKKQHIWQQVKRSFANTVCKSGTYGNH